MIVSFPRDVVRRLEDIERDEGIPVAEQVHQAVAVWTHLRGDDERRVAGFAVMGIVVLRIGTGPN